MGACLSSYFINAIYCTFYTLQINLDVSVICSESQHHFWAARWPFKTGDVAKIMIDTVYCFWYIYSLLVAVHDSSETVERFHYTHIVATSVKLELKYISNNSKKLFYFFPLDLNTFIKVNLAAVAVFSHQVVLKEHLVLFQMAHDSRTFKAKHSGVENMLRLLRSQSSCEYILKEAYTKWAR